MHHFPGKAGKGRFVMCTIYGTLCILYIFSIKYNFLELFFYLFEINEKYIKINEKFMKIIILAVFRLNIILFIPS